MKRPPREVAATGSPQHFRRKAPLVLSQQANQSGHTADAVCQLSKQLGGGTGAKAVQVFDTALKTQLLNRV